MPGMVRPINKASKVGFDILGVPPTLQDDKHVKKLMKSGKKIIDITLDNPQNTNVNYNP